MFFLRKWWQRYPWLRMLLRFVFIAVPLSFLFYGVIGNWQQVQEYEWHFVSYKVILATLFLVSAFSLLPLATQQTLNCINGCLPYRSVYYGYCLSQLAKFLPGGVWIFPGRALVFTELGVDAITSSICLFIELCFLVITAVVVSLPYLFFSETNLPSWVVFLVFTGFTVLLLLIVFKSIGIRLFSRWFPNTAHLLSRFDRVLTVKLIVIDVVFWMAVGAGFFLLVSSVEKLVFADYIPLTAAFSLAWVLGFLAFLTPGGLGVREGVLTVLLLPYIPMPLSALLALAARLWWTIAEMIVIGTAFLFKPKRRNIIA